MLVTIKAKMAVFVMFFIVLSCFGRRNSRLVFP